MKKLQNKNLIWYKFHDIVETLQIKIYLTISLIATKRKKIACSYVQACVLFIEEVIIGENCMLVCTGIRVCLFIEDIFSPNSKMI
jgi:hypothetical protein